MSFRRVPLGSALGPDQKLLQHKLIHNMDRFKPSDANPIQFYNCVRELCLTTSCSIDDGLEAAQFHWPSMENGLKDYYNSQHLSELLDSFPIPVTASNLPEATLRKDGSSNLSLNFSSAVGGRQLPTAESHNWMPSPGRLSENHSKDDNHQVVWPSATVAQQPPRLCGRHMPTFESHYSMPIPTKYLENLFKDDSRPLVWPSPLAQLPSRLEPISNQDVISQGMRMAQSVNDSISGSNAGILGGRATNNRVAAMILFSDQERSAAMAPKVSKVSKVSKVAKLPKKGKPLFKRNNQRAIRKIKLATGAPCRRPVRPVRPVRKL
ncbi:uncharacterized protein LOC110179520 [Drosophila serrata]|uniref:uncharacterized protein LOC110179520 n=1 Tax=Drosophila serrata TaxID=7274 RepID=UPI000A1D3A10|nr:uncharacterized protein LOC110179520 [Drosophila serrata]KAH8388777.1 hypothetical protein KR200_012253 [Drosophila serrata]